MNMRWRMMLLVSALAGRIWAGQVAGADRLSAMGREEYNQMRYGQAVAYLDKIPEAQRSVQDESIAAWSHYYLYEPATARTGFQRILHRYPGSVDSLCGMGWSLHALQRYDEGADAFRKALRLAPWHVSSVDGLNACNAMRPLGGAPRVIPQNRFYGAANYSATYLSYSGDTLRTQGFVHDLQLAIGRVGVGYLDLMFTHSEIDTDAGFAGLRQSEIRPSLGIYAGGLVWRGSGGWLFFSDDTGGDESTWLVGLGLETLNRKINLFVDAYTLEAPDTTLYQAVPGLAYSLGGIGLRSSLEVNHYERQTQDNLLGFYFQQSAIRYLTSASFIYLGGGGGESYYGLRSPGGVFYSLPDKRLADAWLQYGMDLNPWTVSLGVNYAHFEDFTGNPYNSFGATLSFGLYWDGISR